MDNNLLNQAVSLTNPDQTKLSMALNGVSPMVQQIALSQAMQDSANAVNSSLPTLPTPSGLAPSSMNDSTAQPSAGWSDFTTAATDASKQSGFPLSVILGQAALESARGNAAPGNNFFGIKGSGNAGQNVLPTQEYGPNGYYNENSGFAAYKSPADSINAYLNLVESYPGVKEALTTGNPDKILRAIEAGGYATSPTYVQNVEATPEFQGGLK